MELNLLDFLRLLHEAETSLSAHCGILTTADGHTLDICDAIQRATPALSPNEVDGLQTLNPTPLRYWAVTGRIPGDDEDTCHIFQVLNREEALVSFEAAMYANMSEDEAEQTRESVRNEHGQSVFINSVLASNAPIEEL